MGFGEDPGDIARQLRLSLRGGESGVLACLQENLFRTEVHYIGTYVYCLGDGCPFCAIKEPTPRYLTWVIKYITDSKGQPIQPLAGEIKTWLFGRDKYQALNSIMMSIGDIRSTDLRVSCTEEKYQRFTITHTGRSLWLSDKEFASRMIAAFEAVKRDPIDIIARYVSREAAPAYLEAQARRELNRPSDAGMVESGGRYPSTQAPSNPASSSDVLASTQTLKDLLSQVGS